MSPELRLGLLWASAASLGVAGFVVPWKLAASHGDSRVNTLILLVAAALLSSVVTSVQQRALPRFSRFDLVFGAVLGVLTLVGNLASAVAIVSLSPALLSVVQRGEVILVALIAWLLIGEGVDRRYWLGAAVAVAGLLLLSDPFGEGETAEARGLALAAFSTLCFSSMAVLTRMYIQRIDTVAVNGLRLWLSALFWVAFYGLPPELLDATPQQVLYASLAAFFGPFLGRLCMMNSARYLEARITTLAILAAPPLSLLLGFLILDDLPGLQQIGGGLLMLAGVAIPVLGFARR